MPTTYVRAKSGRTTLFLPLPAPPVTLQQTKALILAMHPEAPVENERDVRVLMGGRVVETDGALRSGEWTRATELGYAFCVAGEWQEWTVEEPAEYDTEEEEEEAVVE